MKMAMKDAIEEATKLWLDIEHVVGVGQGKFNDNDCIEVFVVEVTEELEKRIPKNFRGYVVRIQEVGVISAQDKK